MGGGGRGGEVGEKKVDDGGVWIRTVEVRE